MKEDLHILILEDVPTDAELIQFELTDAGITFTPCCVADRASYLKALDEFGPDIILSDYSLPSFDGLSALKQMTQVRIIEENLREIVSPFLRRLSSSYLDLTPREIDVANLVKEGKTTKEITDILNISATAVDFHRKNLRAKFGIKSKKTNLMAFLSSLS